MPPDTQADGPGGPKARRTRGPASPRQRTAQPFGGDAECVPPCVVRRGHRSPAGVRRAAVHEGPRPPRAFRRPPAGRRTRGASASRGGSATHAGRRTHGASALAGIPQAATHADRRPRGASALAGVPRPMQTAAHAGHRPSQAFRRPLAGRRHAQGIGPRGRSATHAARRTSRGLGHPRAFRGPRRTPPTRGIGPRGPRRPRRRSPRLPPPAARPHPPAARFSRKPPCGIGPRMVYCT